MGHPDMLAALPVDYFAAWRRLLHADQVDQVHPSDLESDRLRLPQGRTRNRYRSLSSHGKPSFCPEKKHPSVRPFIRSDCRVR